MTQHSDERGAELRELALRLRENPELGYHEEKASAWLTEYLGKQGFQVPGFEIADGVSAITCTLQQTAHRN